jgi:outer membrane protein assembly factor BamB
VTCDVEGNVEGSDAKTGKPLWTAKTGAPYFAGAALAGDAAYTADIDGKLHAIGLADGKVRWTLDLAADPAVKAPGMVYGSPIVHGGRIYVGTSNLEGKFAGAETVIVCIGEAK